MSYLDKLKRELSDLERRCCNSRTNGSVQASVVLKRMIRDAEKVKELTDDLKGL